MLTALTDRMQMLEVSQIQMLIDDDERLQGTIDSGFFALALGSGMGCTTLHRNALGYDASRRPRGRVCVTQPGDSLFQQFGPQYVGPGQPSRATRPRHRAMRQCPLQILKTLKCLCQECIKRRCRSCRCVYWTNANVSSLLASLMGQSCTRVSNWVLWTGVEHSYARSRWAAGLWVYSF
uniref:RxLR effector candidate protein n=1 Tax=Hyaloperonospora arabidopsidis (strain Emoy2) TaxID=559515 RepID=M4B6C4_HYAAE